MFLADAGRHTDFLRLYDQHYASLRQADLDCLAAAAHQSLGHVSTGNTLGRRLWLVGRSQVSECDVVFDAMRASDALAVPAIADRYELAVAARNFSLARYLARSLDNAAQAQAGRWLSAQNDPERYLRRADISNSDDIYAAQLAYAARRLAYREPVAALKHWERLSRDMAFSDALDHDIRRYAALWAARRHLPEAAQLLMAVPADAVDTEVARWRVRVALTEQRWEQVNAGIAAFDDREKQREEWRYWLGIAQDRLGNRADAMLTLSQLARERSYYGFLAADQLKRTYAFQSAALESEDGILEQLNERDDIARARELFYVGLEGRARSEWDAAVRDLTAREKVQATLLAHSWGWHSRAIAAAAQSGEYDDLSVRYPLPHRKAFQTSANAAGVRESWAYGIARSESLFMRDVRSSAGAIGVMQLMPGTGRDTAREINHPYRGRNTLTDPDSNIRLGTRYLANMHRRFDSHPALATAAYNAGPQRVSAWLNERVSRDARVWIETIPFNETRSYVRRVLTADVIFHWRLTGKVRRLSEQLPPIPIDSRAALSSR